MQLINSIRLNTSVCSSGWRFKSSKILRGERERERETGTERQTETETDRDRQTETDRDRQRQTDREGL